jgi:tetratricopeptide (TPR) repeat protein
VIRSFTTGYALALLLSASHAFAQNASDVRSEARQLFAAGYELLHKGLPDAAAIQFERGLEFDPADYKARFLLAESYLKASKNEKAIVQYEKVLETAPKISEESAVSEAKLAVLRRVVETSPERQEKKAADRLAAKRREIIRGLTALSPARVFLVGSQGPQSPNALLSYFEGGGAVYSAIELRITDSVTALPVWRNDADLAQSIVTGQTLVGVAAPGSRVSALVQQGKIKALLVSGPARADSLPDVPTAAEAFGN